MSTESRELAIYAINNRDLYRQRTQPILKNLQRKIAKGNYDAALALKLWKYAADDAAQRYAKEFGGVWHSLFSVADRKEAAKEMADHYAEELRENPRRSKTLARYQVLFGMPGYMPDSNTGPYYASTRKELAAFFRDMLSQYDLPKSLFNQIKLKRLWPFIKAHGSSTAHVTLYHKNNVIEFIGLTEAEAEEMERQSDY